MKKMFQKSRLKNATAVLVLGILSVVLFFSFGIGLILGIIGLALSSKPRKLYKENPSSYEGFGALNAGWILSIIGTCLGGLHIILVIIWFAFVR